MKAVRVHKTLGARELPEAWREEGRFAPDQRVTVVIEPGIPSLRPPPRSRPSWTSSVGVQPNVA